MKKNGNIAEDLLVKYLLNETSEAEQKQVSQWIDASDANKTRFDHLRLVWEESGKIAATGTIDTDEAWARFKQRTNQPRRTLPAPVVYRWAKIAAAVLLLAGGSLVAWFIANREEPKVQVVQQTQPAPANQQLSTKDTPKLEQVAVTPVVVSQEKTANINNATRTQIVTHRAMAFNTKNKFLKHNYTPGIFRYDRTKDFICNNTPCPIEICIKQTVKCPNGTTEDISTCSVLEPDESGQLRYKAFDRLKHSCSTTVEEITIKRVSTGETIVLNADSKPATAQEFFSYITGQKKGDITAGIFHTDCNNNKDDCGLTFNNSNLILE